MKKCNKENKICEKKFCAIMFSTNGVVFLANESDDLEEILDCKWVYEQTVLDGTNGYLIDLGVESEIVRIIITDRKMLHTYWDSNDLDLDSVLADHVMRANPDSEDGKFTPADRILADLLQDGSDGKLAAGIAETIINEWQSTAERHSVELVFEMLTGISFHEFLVRCKESGSKENQ